MTTAVRTAVVRQYEHLVEAADCRLGWVDGTSLACLPTWSASLAAERGLHLRVQLQPTYYSVAVFLDGKLEDLRVKLQAIRDQEALTEEPGEDAEG